MSARINLPILPGWAELTDSQRWHAGYLARKLDDSGYVAEWRPGCVNQIHFRATEDEARVDYLERFAQDSLLCALTHTDKLIVLRSLLQAREYVATVQALGRPTGYLNGAMTTAQNRLEDWIRADDDASRRQRIQLQARD